MEAENQGISKDLLRIDPLAEDTKLVISKKTRNLDDLRQNFKASPSSVLSQVRDFLPKLASANEDLQRRMKQEGGFSADIEQLEDEDAPHIEMSLALVEQDGSEESDTDSESENEDVTYGEVTEDNIKLPYNTSPSKPPLIQALNKQTDSGPIVGDLSMDCDNNKSDEQLDT